MMYKTMLEQPMWYFANVIGDPYNPDDNFDNLCKKIKKYLKENVFFYISLAF